MSKPISRLWFLGPPAAILLSALVYYAKFSSVRQWVDARFPWVAENVGSRLPPLIAPSQESSDASSPATSSIPPGADEPAREMPERVRSPIVPSFLAADGTVEIQKLAAERSAWPPTVKLRRALEFPAVVNGKVVGKVEAPVGTEAKLVAIRDGKLGLEYQGGGAWLSAEETDLAQRLRR